MSSYCTGPANMCRYHESGGTDTRCGDFAAFDAVAEIPEMRLKGAERAYLVAAGLLREPSDVVLHAGHRAGKTQPIATAVERVDSGTLGTWYSVTVELASHTYHVRLAAAGRARFILGARTASGNMCRSQHRALVEQAARKAVIS